MTCCACDGEGKRPWYDTKNGGMICEECVRETPFCKYLVKKIDELIASNETYHDLYNNLTDKLIKSLNTKDKE